jgi:hypothetical protein
VTYDRCMNTDSYDLWYDATSVGGDLVTDTFIHLGPRAEDASFDPQPGDVLLAGDDDEPPVPATVVRRYDDRVWIRLELDVRV